MMNFNQLLKQAQQMQKQVTKVKKEFDERTYDFESQQGFIKGKLNGQLQLVELSISDELLSLDNKEMLQDLLMLTINESIKTIEKEKEDTLNKVTNGVDVSGFL